MASYALQTPPRVAHAKPHGPISFPGWLIWNSCGRLSWYENKRGCTISSGCTPHTKKFRDGLNSCPDLPPSMEMSFIIYTQVCPNNNKKLCKCPSQLISWTSFKIFLLTDRHRQTDGQTDKAKLWSKNILEHLSNGSKMDQTIERSSVFH